MKNKLSDLNDHLFMMLERLNDLSDLNDHLFMMLERLNDNTVKGDELTEELKRAKGVVAIANSIIANANVQVEAYKAVNGVGDDYCDMPK